MSLINVNYNYFHSKNKDVQKKLINSKNYTYQTLISLVDKYFQSPSKVLDIGCGVGVIDFYLAKKGFNVSGIDISTRAINLAIASSKSLNIKNVNFQVKDLNKDKVLGTFDYVVCSEVIEHISNIKSLISQITQVTNEKSLIIISTPLSKSPLYRLGYLNIFDYEVGHLRRFTKNSLEKELTNCGFEIIEIRQVEGILRNSLYTIKPMGVFLKFVRWPISLIVNAFDYIAGKVLGFSNLYIVVRKK